MRAQHHSLKAAVRRELRPTLGLALPIVLAEVGWMAMAIVDTLMVGRLPQSAVALGAVSLGSMLYAPIAFFGSGLLLGLDTLVAQAFGRRDLQDARQSLAAGVALALLLALPLMALTMLCTPLMRAFGVDARVVAAMGPFLGALNWGTLPLLLYYCLRRYLQAVDVVKPVTFALVSANLVNALGNWIFIFGHWGAPALGLVGSGWSTCVARAYMAGVLWVATWRYLRKHPAAPTRVSWQRVGEVARIGLPAAMQIVLEIGVFATVTALIGRLGAVPLAGHQIAVNCASLTYMVPLGVSSAAAVRVGHALGRGDVAGAREAGNMAIALGAAFMACAGIVLVAAPRLIARAFTADTEVIASGATLLVIAAAFQLFDGLQTVATGALRGAGDTRTPMLMNLAAYWALGLPLGCLLCFRYHYGAAGLWSGLCVGLIVLGSALLRAWRSRMAQGTLRFTANGA